MTLPSDYWESYEHCVGTLTAFLEAVQVISGFRAATGARFVWRGAAQAQWPLSSSLARHAAGLHGGEIPAEPELQEMERAIIEDARDWGLDWHATGGRLAALELLSALQHYGVPTRLLDFSYSPLVALWFAVEKDDDVDGRVFAIDISTRLVTRAEAANAEPWWFSISSAANGPWRTESWIWRPPPLEARMVRQEGCFLMGGVPSTQPPRNARIDGGWRLLRRDEVRTCMSVPFRLLHYNRAQQAADGNPREDKSLQARAFTIRVTNKQVVRQQLEQTFSYSARSLFPDLPGFAEYGHTLESPRSQARRSPPDKIASLPSERGTQLALPF